MTHRRGPVCGVRGDQLVRVQIVVGGSIEIKVSPAGPELLPKFSPDGRTIAFVGNYEGNRDLYVVPAEGGVSARVTHHPAVETLCDWTADGRLLYATNGFAGLARQTQLHTVSPSGGLPTKLPVPYGANGAISADGQVLAYTPHSIDFRTWKRYRGGMQTDIWLFDLKARTSKQITDWEGLDSLPMWHGETVYYLSDAGANHRLNIWSYDSKTGERKQITDFADYDVKWPSIGPGKLGKGEIVFQNGSELFLLDLSTGKSREVLVSVPGDRPKIRPRNVEASEFIAAWDVSPTGKRALFEARGDIWTAPAREGVPRNLSRTSGVAERDPGWSPDGQWIAYFSDATGEYELYVVQSEFYAKGKRIATLDAAKLDGVPAGFARDAEDVGQRGGVEGPGVEREPECRHGGELYPPWRRTSGGPAACAAPAGGCLP